MAGIFLVDLPLAIVAALACAAFVSLRFFKFQKVGGLYHWRIGRVGGSFYLSRH